MSHPSALPSGRYRRPRYAPDLPDRRWPSRTIDAAPRWCAVDLRDGNQALLEPMSPDQRLRMFRLLVALGFREIEVGFPAAVPADHDLLRRLVDDDLVPADVSIQVITGAHPRWIERTVRALHGARRPVVHLFTTTSELQRRVVLGTDPAGAAALAAGAAATCLDRAAAAGVEVQLEYTMDSWTETEPEVALRVCAAVIEAVDPTPQRPLIVNLPATVEVSTPNAFADSVEWMHRNLPRRESLVLSLHPHNDRGTAVAAAELGLLAGAERVEGCLFGLGERAGNLDLVTLALNLFAHGVDPGLDLSALDEVVRTAQECTGAPVPQRQPYAGDLVFTALAGTHQHAIDRGMAAMAADAAAAGVAVTRWPWRVPYLGVDPADLGREYRAVVRDG